MTTLATTLRKSWLSLTWSSDHLSKAAGREGLSEQSDKLITEAAKYEHQQLKDRVIRAVKAWRYAKDGPLAKDALSNAIDVLIRFETNHRERLNG